MVNVKQDVSKMFSDMFLIIIIIISAVHQLLAVAYHWVATQGTPSSPCYLSLLFGIRGQAAELK